MKILPQFSLFPEGGDQVVASAHAPQGAGGGVTEFPAVLGTEVGQFMLLEMTPDVLGGIQFGGIGWQGLQVDALVQCADEVTHRPTSMNPSAIPDNQQSAGQMPQQMAQELDDLGTLDRSVKELEIEVGEGQSRHHRELLPIEVVLQHRRTTTRGPSANPVRLLAQSALINEDNQPIFAERFFLMSGQRCRFQWRMACSLRSSARPTGRWQLQPNCWRRR